MKKLIKSIFKFVCPLVLSIFCAMGSFSMQTLDKAASAQSMPASQERAVADIFSEDFFDFFNLSIAGYTFTPDDFYNDEQTDALFNSDNNQYFKGVLFTNRTITLSTRNLVASSVDTLTVSTIQTYDYNTYTVTSNVTNVVVIGERSNKGNVYNFALDPAAPKIEKYLIAITRTYYDNILGQPRQEVLRGTFVIVQIPQNYNMNSGVTYSYDISNNLSSPNIVTVSDMSTGKTYSPVNVKIKSGTVLNPTYIHFIKNGENYNIYNIDGVFYNSLDDSELPLLTDNTLPLTASGIYEISIYDKTAMTSSPSANVVKDTFMIRNNSSNTSSVFLTAISSSSAQVASGETTNENVSVTFYNLNTTVVKKLVIRKTLSSGDIHSIDTTYTDRFPSFYECNQDYKYTFIIEFNYNPQTETRPDDYLYEFQIIKDIRSSYTTPDNQLLTANHSNVITIEDIYQENHLSYGYGIESVNIYNYKVKLAKSNPSISGIANNGSASGAVTLTIYGVGEIKTTIYTNGTPGETQILQSGDKIELSNAAKYTVVITDEMGTVISKNFTISMKVNTAGILLIVVGGLLVAGGIFFIIRSRSKVSVR